MTKGELDSVGNAPFPDVKPEFTVLEELKSGDRRCLLLYDAACRRKMILKSGPADRTENEAVMLERFSGEGVPKLYGCFTRDGVSYLFREYVEGRTLKEILNEKGCFSAREAAEIGIKICRVLEKMHSCKPAVIHRDIKTENVILTPSGEIFIIDFDIAREYDGNSSRDTRVLGTPLTAPPEQFGYSQTDERSDVYAVGVLLCELVYGSVRPEPQKLSGKLGKIIKRCTGFDPQSRYENAIGLRAALEGMISEKAAKISAAAITVVLGLFVSFFAGTFVHAHLPEKSDDLSNPVYSFADEGMEAAVRDILGRPKGKIYQSDLDGITKIVLIGDRTAESYDSIITHGNEISVDGEMIGTYGNISDISDIKNMPNLQSLVLANQRISDLGPLPGTGVMELMLHGNNISDISPLADCPSLKKLSLSSNPISDISPISSLPALSVLDLGATDITSLNDCAKIRCLNQLIINDCPKLEDYSALSEMNSVTFLSLRPTPDEAFDAVVGMKNLRALFLWGALKLTSLDQLSQLKDLNYLGLDGCRLESLDGAENFQNLDSLAFRFNYISDLSPLEDLPRLKVLAIVGNPVESLDPVGKITDLNTLMVDERQAALIPELGEGVQIVVEE